MTTYSFTPKVEVEAFEAVMPRELENACEAEKRAWLLEVTYTHILEASENGQGYSITMNAKEVSR